MPDAITDEGVARLRERIGIPRPHTNPPHYLSPNEDAFRHVAESYGDDNPLWCDPSYGPTTRWGGTIAPPHLVGGDTLIGEDEVTRLEGEVKAKMKGDPLGGVHAFYSGSFREWWNPLRPGTRVTRRNALVGVHDKSGDFAGRTVHEWSAEVFAAAGGPVLSGQFRLMIRAEREKATERKKNELTEIEPYSDEEIAAIDEALAGEGARRRGAEVRYWEDVEEGDEIPTLVKGPLRVTDMVVWHTGMGMGLYGVKALRLAYDQRQRVPRFFKPDDLNIPDVQQRVHWDPEWAHRAGNPACYDYGRMRETWLIHLCTDWMGDDAWLWKLDCQFRKFNYVGDTHWMRGKVTRKYLAEGGRPAVDLSIWGDNQRGETTTPGHATILLPSRERGDVVLPDPPGGATTCQEALDALAERFAAEEHGVKPYPEIPPGLIVEHLGSVLRVCLDRPERRNSITDPIVYALADTVDAAASDESVRVIHLEGSGDHFSSGFDLSQRTPGPDRPRVGSVHRRMNGHVNRLIPAMLTCQTPIVCTARGWVIGLGLDLVLASDFAVVADDARLWAPFTTFGFTPDSGATWLIPRLAGVARAREMLILGEKVSGSDAATWGLVHRAVPAADLDETSQELITRLAKGPTVAMGLTKLLLHRAATNDIPSHLADEAWAMEVSSRSEDFKEYGNASREKREPRFTGQ